MAHQEFIAEVRAALKDWDDGKQMLHLSDAIAIALKNLDTTPAEPQAAQTVREMRDEQLVYWVEVNGIDIPDEATDGLVNLVWCAAWQACATRQPTLPVAEWQEAAEGFRDTLLNQRGALAGNGMTNDQINDCLHEFDCFFHGVFCRRPCRASS